MAKIKTIFYCQGCGYQSPKWLGRCPDCGTWNSLVEERVEPVKADQADHRWISVERADGGGDAPIPISEIDIASEPRSRTGSREFDRVLGGGVVAGSVILIGGDPGIGKSTLILQSLNQIGKGRGKVLYVSGEESPMQIKLRAERLGISSDYLYVLAETALEEIVSQAEALAPVAIVIDSIQTIYTRQLSSAPGSVTQIRETASQLMFYAKRAGVAVFIIGHVTKDGAIAGPRVLEHIVDTVLYFEGDKSHSYRVLRAVKNRFGSANEIGLFEMKGSGLIEVENPSGLFLSERPRDASGSVVVAAQEGTRPMLVELQALVSTSYLGTARRMALGVDANRVSLLLAILEKRAGLQLSGQDIFVNVVSGIQISEPAIDLGILAAVCSSFREKPIDAETVLFGEVGLAGEIRGIQQALPRIREAEKLGFKRCILPRRNEETLQTEGEADYSVETVGVSHIEEALEVLFSTGA
ncbi:MAG: DNA repair protein RadA [Nitrospira sp.]|nr:DNA repair protein RadA [Candidatus Manganitrophaceae bacterium]HIL35819.1 DNA repair protein RadA [Candidatus Manganitrophaceae bacterium]